MRSRAGSPIRIAIVGLGVVGRWVLEALLRDEARLGLQFVAAADRHSGLVYRPDGLEIREVLDATATGLQRLARAANRTRTGCARRSCVKDAAVMKRLLKPHTVAVTAWRRWAALQRRTRCVGELRGSRASSAANREENLPLADSHARACPRERASTGPTTCWLNSGRWMSETLALVSPS
jgi:hypothetical protein